jgi:serine/threonine-protein kinase HipA
MGALEFEPTMIQESRKSFPVEIDSLIETAQKMLSNKDKFSVNLQKDEQKALMEIVKIGTSAGGARPKAVIAYNESTGEVKSGQTETPKGFEHWLIKLDGVSAVQLGSSNGYGRVEMAYYKMAVACGINMMPSRLLEENGRAHFMTRRFDRSEGSIKHHIQTFCAMKHVDFNQIQSFSYEQLFQTMRELKLNYFDTDQMFRRMAFNVIARNCDDHTKNFAFSLKEGGKWELAPAYDICHAYRPGSDWVSQHSLSIQNKRKDFTKDDLLKFGESVQCKNAGYILAEIKDVVSRWTQFANETQVSEKIRDEIGKTHLILI